ncbi:septum formation family protein [Frankia gtarii]|uniref:septum formation family protein n=2 Tax=Frankia gtarii TaxID=2950102 RepID=UPI0021BF4B43|nr:septum formation family protein [Frankia gtarii]
MASRHQDPFEGLRLDERFVRGARFLEPSAAERGRQHDRSVSSRCQVVPAPRGLPGFFHRLVSPPKPPGRSWQIAQMVTFIAIIVGMITITVVALRQTATRGGPGTATRLSSTTASQGGSASGAGAVRAVTGSPAGPPAGFAVSPALLAALHRGDCLNWTPYQPSAPVPIAPVVPVRVGCDRPHIDEVTRLVNLASMFGRWPGASAVAQAADARCAGALRDFAGAIDATPHLIVGTIYPSEPSWQEGARLVACTVRTDDLHVRTGRFRVVGLIGT